MKKLIQIVSLGALLVGGLGASTITTPSELGGTTSTYNVSTFDAKSSTMSGLQIAVTWWDGTTGSCSWSNATGGCSSSGKFSISENDGLLDAYDGVWSFTNLFNPQNATSIKSITLIGSGVDNPTGLVGFDICWSGSAASGSQDWTNAGSFLGLCGQEGTSGTNIGWTASSTLFGRNISTSSFTYTDRVRLPNGPASGVGDEFSEVTLNFANGVFTRNSQSSFDWRMDADVLLAAPVPEPATFGLVGLALLALISLAKRTRVR